MDRESFAPRCGKVDVNFFRAIGPVIRLVECEDNRNRRTRGDGQRRSRRECCAGAIIVPGPEWCTTQARALQGQRFVVSLLVTAIMIPYYKHILKSNGPGIWI